MKTFNKYIFALIALLIFALLLMFGKNYIIKAAKEIAQVPSIRVKLISIAKVAIPLKDQILLRSLDDQIALIKSSGSCTFCDLTQVNLTGVDLSGVDLRYATLIEAELSNTNLNGARLSFANLLGANLDGANLTGTLLDQANLSKVSLDGVNLRNTDLSKVSLDGVDLSGVDLRNMDLTGINLTGVDLSNKDLSGANLSGVDLSNKDLTGSILTQVNLSGANLNGVDLKNIDLTGVNLTGVDLKNMDLTGTNVNDAITITMKLVNESSSNWSTLNELKNLNVTKYDLSGDIHYLATKEGFLFELKNNKLNLVLDLNIDAQFTFDNSSFETGLLGIASLNEHMYISYSSLGINGLNNLVVDEYSENFTKVRNIIIIEGFEQSHFGGNLQFDSLGNLYLSVGDGENNYDESQAQNLNSLRGKILKLDVLKLQAEPEIIAYGLRQPMGTIDSKDRMFIAQCGNSSVEAVYLLNNLYTGVPVNFGWPVFEGSTRMLDRPLTFNEVSAPISEHKIRPGCLTAGVYLDDIEAFLLGDFYGTIRLLKQKESGEWYMLHELKIGKNTSMYEGSFIWGFGFDKKTKKIFIAPNNLELEILIDQVKPN
jgi:uncharacterized protein YjbI with pentapeptide repeats